MDEQKTFLCACHGIEDCADVADLLTTLKGHVKPSPPAPPRSEQETAREEQLLDDALRCADCGRFFNIDCPVGCGGTLPVPQIEQAFAAALEGAARDAAKKEREKCCAAACYGCASGFPTYRDGPTIKHRSPREGITALCTAAVLRALPPEEGK